MTKQVYLALLAASVAFLTGPLHALDSQALFERYEAAVFQVRVINRDTGKKSTIGSGFVFDRPDRLATNYHVVSRFIEKPDAYELRYLSAAGDEGALTLVAVDAVHDLALLAAPRPLGEPLQLGEPPAKGAGLYAMGNPLDLGLTIAAGTNGGVLSQTDEGRILFSGSLNPGMSGGPTFDDRGRVVGINVATARNDISFIVPSRFLIPLGDAPLTSPAGLRAEIARQIREHQARYLRRIGETAWSQTSIRQLQAPGALSPTIRCWDASPKPKEDQLYRRFNISCKNENTIFLSDTLDVGKILYEYIWLESDALEPLRFYRLYDRLNASQFSSRATEDDVGRFRCETRFVHDSGPVFKASMCTRAYKNYPGLVDILFTAALVGSPRTGFIFNMDLAGTEFESANRLIMRMLKEIRWQP